MKQEGKGQMKMRVKIETAMNELIGQPLTSMWRYAGLQKFEFGVQKPSRNRKGEKVTHADWGLVVTCRWQIDDKDENKIVGSEDFGPQGARRDSGASEFYKRLWSDPPIVQSIEGNVRGDVYFTMSEGYTLDIRVQANLDEQWRLMPPKDKMFQIVLTEHSLDTVFINA